MKNIRHDSLSLEKLGQPPTLSSRGDSTGNSPGPITYHADPHIRGKRKKGIMYYYYRRGADREMYLGTANNILEACLEKRAKIAR